MVKSLTHIIKRAALLIVLLTAVSCAPKQQFVIVSTNDIHSAIDAFPALATLVDSLRGEYPERFLLVDAGDRWTGNPYVDFAEHRGKPIIELMNELGYDVATYGNHEWDNGVDTLAVRMKETEFTNILANADFTGTPMPATEPYILKEINGVRIAMVGLITIDESGHPVGKDESYGEIEFTDPLKTAMAHSALRENCDLYIAVTHIGAEPDSLLAMQSPEIDLIIGGHSHTVIPVGKKINNTVITQTGKGLKYAGVTVVTHRGGKILGIENSLVELADIAPSAKYQEMVDRYNSNPHFKQKVGEVTDNMDKIALMNLYSDIMREGTESQFALYNLGGMRINKQAKGDIILEDIFSAEPFGNAPETLLMSMEEIKDMVLNKFNSTGKESHTLDLYPSGMRYKIVTDGEGNATDIFFETDQKPISGDKYRVALSDYVISSYDFAQKGKGEPYGEVVTTLAERYIRANSPITPETKNRVEIE